MILVTGAGGSNGSELTKQLSAKGVSVRAMVRKSSPLESDALPGVEFVTADFDDLASVNRALEGVQSAFLVTNSSDRTETQQLRFVEAARAASVRHIVYLSQIHARKDSPVRFLRYHAVVEEAIAASGMTFTILRPNLYMQGLLGFRASRRTEPDAVEPRPIFGTHPMTKGAASNFSFIEPMKALRLRELPVGDWLYEMKFDGYRALAFKAGKEVRLVSRNQTLFNEDYPQLIEPRNCCRPRRFRTASMISNCSLLDRRLLGVCFPGAVPGKARRIPFRWRNLRVDPGIRGD